MIEHLLQPLVSERFRHEERYREGHLRVVNALPSRRVLGLHTPDTKLIAKHISREGCLATMSNGEIVRCANGTEAIRCFVAMPSAQLCYEETLIWGMLINLERCPLEERLEMLERYVPVLDNWAVCDSFCSHAKWMLRADKDMLWSFLQQWYDSKREFEVRFAIVVSMCYFLNEEWLQRLFRRIDSLDFEAIKSEYRSAKGKPQIAQQGTVQGLEPYYVRMGVAWLLATALAKFPNETRAYVNASRLPEDVIKLYVRKARESFKTRDVAAL